MAASHSDWVSSLLGGVGLDVEVGAQGGNVVLKGFEADGGDPAQGAWLLALKGLLDGNIARRGQFVELHTQVARRGPGLLLDVGELGLIDTDEQRHDGQAQLGVQQWV